MGNNWDGDAESFDAHIASISDTWLRFPVGSGYAYSNLGIDLAGDILQTVTGQAFADYVRDRLLEPLGMLDTSFDAEVIAAADDLAVGQGRLCASSGPCLWCPLAGCTQRQRP